MCPGTCIGTGKRFLLASKVAVCLEQDGSAALILMQEGAVLEMRHKLLFSLHETNE